jgi:hypothetical protein
LPSTALFARKAVEGNRPYRRFSNP